MTRASWGWPLALIGLLAAGAGFDVLVWVVASRDPSFAVERDYYRKALDWDRAMAQAARNAELGWRAIAALEREPGAEAHSRLRVTLADRGGTPIPGAAVRAELFHNARSGHVLAVRLDEEAAGVYAAAVPAARPGLWEVRLAATRDGATYTETLRVEQAGRP